MTRKARLEKQTQPSSIPIGVITYTGTWSLRTMSLSLLASNLDLEILELYQGNLFTFGNKFYSHNLNYPNGVYLDCRKKNILGKGSKS